MSAVHPGHDRAVMPAAEPSPRSVRFASPRYWPAWVLIGWFWLSSRLPWSLALRVNAGVGRLMWLSMSRHRDVVERNIRSCFPDLDERRVRRLVRRHFGELGRCLGESAYAWFGRVDDSRVPFRVEGEEHVRAALQKGKGVILSTGHFTTVEICGAKLKSMFPLFGFMFHRRRNALLDEFQRLGRRHLGHIAVPSNDIRAMLDALRRNGVVWYAPDQRAPGRRSVDLKFLGQSMQVSDAAARIARVADAAIVPFSYCRLPGKQGYCLRFEPCVEFEAADSAEAVTERINGPLEAAIQRCPEQYAWTRQFLKRRLPRWSLPLSASDVTAPAAGDRDQGRWHWTDLASAALIGLVALFITVADNGAFFASLFQATAGDPNRLAIMGSLSVLVFGLIAFFLALVPGRRLLGAAAAVLLTVGATADFFMRYYGVVFDSSMVRNILETDAREASGLMSAQLLLHVVEFGIIPAILVLYLLPRPASRSHEFLARLAVAAVSILSVVGVLYANFGSVSYFAHEHHELRLQINPLYPIYEFAMFEASAMDRPEVTRQTLDATMSPYGPADDKPTLVVFVMGETARADRFSLNGYTRATNRYTQDRDVVNFAHATSCGTSTADSVPCVFSRFGRDEFSHAKFDREESLLQMLARLGVAVHWRDNSTGCKAVCDPADFESLAGARDVDFCHDDVCVDEILLAGLESLVDETDRDRLVVLHERGSHGPAYYKDTPPFAKAWLPECGTAGLHECDSVSINNAYDNTILYTDYMLSRVIDVLEEESDRYRVAMFYVSDHGESLGENGLYLHGYPYALAPREQTQIPMLLWASDDFYEEQRVDTGCLRDSASEPVSHDFVFHTLVRIYGVSTPLYDPNLDLLGKCRIAHGHSWHKA